LTTPPASASLPSPRPGAPILPRVCVCVCVSLLGRLPAPRAPGPAAWRVLPPSAYTAAVPRYLCLHWARPATPFSATHRARGPDASVRAAVHHALAGRTPRPNVPCLHSEEAIHATRPVRQQVACPLPRIGVRLFAPRAAGTEDKRFVQLLLPGTACTGQKQVRAAGSMLEQANRACMFRWMHADESTEKHTAECTSGLVNPLTMHIIAPQGFCFLWASGLVIRVW
jgi:hypothetical protein